MASLPLLACNEYSNNPLGQNLILELVLEHVGKADIDDLLNCRLVSRSWNQVAVQVLEEQHGYALELDYEKLLTFKSLLWTSRMSRMNSEGEELESLRLSLSLLPKKCSEQCSALVDSAQLLAFHPYLRFAFISIQYKEDDSDKDNPRTWHPLTNLELFTLFKLASADLAYLAILDYNWQIPAHFEKFEFNSYLDLEFPRLTSVDYRVTSCSTRPELLDLTNHVVHIAKRAPKLIKMHLDLYDEIDSERSILESCSANLEELEFGTTVAGLVKLLSEIKLPKLRLFTAEKVGTISTLNEFAKLNCPTLTHIQIGLDEYTTYNEELLEFPLLPNILNFGLHTFPKISSRFNELIRAIFSQMLPKLTSLKSLRLDLSVLFILGTHLKNSGQLIPSPDQYPVFPGLSALEIHILAVGTKMFDVLDMTIRIYHHTFPNLETLTIKPSTEDSEGTLLDGKTLARAVEFLCFHPGIQNLEIHNYAQDWLNQPSILSHTFPGVKSLRLLTPPKGEDGPRMNLMELLTRFPALEFLQMGKELVTLTEIQGLRKLIKRLENPFTRNRKRTH